MSFDFGTARRQWPIQQQDAARTRNRNTGRDCLVADAISDTRRQCFVAERISKALCRDAVTAIKGNERNSLTDQCYKTYTLIDKGQHSLLIEHAQSSLTTVTRETAERGGAMIDAIAERPHDVDAGIVPGKQVFNCLLKICVVLIREVEERYTTMCSAGGEFVGVEVPEDNVRADVQA